MKATLNRLTPDTVAALIAGAAGTLAATTLADAVDAVEVPAAFVAVAEHVYDFVAVRLETTIGDDEPLADCATPPLLDTHVTE